MASGTKRRAATLLACLLAGSVGAPPTMALAPGEPAPPAPVAGQPAAPRPAAKAVGLASWHEKRGKFFERNWGVDVVGVRRVSSGMMLRFEYRVVDPERAAVLTDRRNKPYLIDEATRTALAVPAMENIGELRQVAPLEPGRTYFVIFGNPGGLVKRGGKVTLVAGDLRAAGLTVD